LIEKGKIMQNNSDINQLRQQIEIKRADLANCSRDLKTLTTRRATQQRAVTIKENKIHDFAYKSNLTAAESEKLATLTRELKSDKQELENRNEEMGTCSQLETNLILELGRLKMELSKLENSEASSHTRISFGR
jgi:flagellar motor switch/type III secretory pathway protein FliN